MSHDAINSWVDKAKTPIPQAVKQAAIQVVKREVKSRGNIIMEIAEKIRPFLAKMFEGARDENGMLFQPAHIHGVALNVAQSFVKKQEENK